MNLLSKSRILNQSPNLEQRKGHRELKEDSTEDRKDLEEDNKFGITYSIMRNSVFAGAFYPSDKKEIEKLIESFPKGNERKVLGLVVPHAGYAYSGKTAALGFSSVEKKFETVIIIGTNHNALGMVSVSGEEWKTPLGTLKPDIELIREITEDSIIEVDEESQKMEHSIEVQLPLMQHFFKEFKIVAISINPYYFDVVTCKDVGEKIAEAVKKLNRNVLIVASSDFTHYGSSYGYVPFDCSKAPEKVKELDMNVINKILELKPEEVIRTSEKGMTVCGYGAIAAMLYAVKKLGAKQAKLIDYSTSYDVSKNRNAVVGYASISVG